MIGEYVTGPSAEAQDQVGAWGSNGGGQAEFGRAGIRKAKSGNQEAPLAKSDSQIPLSESE